MKFQENIELSTHTTFKIGGPASFFVVVHTLPELKEALLKAREQNVPVFILGGGSNILVSDEGFKGLVIKIALRGVTYEEGDDVVRVVSGAGENWDDLVEDTVHRSLYGLENLSSIPGTVGAAPIQNIGAYGGEVSSVIAWVEALNLDSMKVQKFSNAECLFSYRDSFFKQPRGKSFVVTRVCFELNKKGSINKTYKDVAMYFKDHAREPTLEEVRDAIIATRKGKFPDLAKVGTAGSFFKNPIITKEQAEALKSKYPDLPCYAYDESHCKVSLAFILDHILELKGLRKGAVGTFSKQPLVLVNHEGATAKDVRAFARKITKIVKEKVDITIVPEVTFVP